MVDEAFPFTRTHVYDVRARKAAIHALVLLSLRSRLSAATFGATLYQRGFAEVQQLYVSLAFVVSTKGPVLEDTDKLSLTG